MLSRSRGAVRVTWHAVSFCDWRRRRRCCAIAVQTLGNQTVSSWLCVHLVSLSVRPFRVHNVFQLGSVPGSRFNRELQGAPCDQLRPPTLPVMLHWWHPLQLTLFSLPLPGGEKGGFVLWFRAEKSLGLQMNERLKSCCLSLYFISWNNAEQVGMATRRSFELD